MEKVKFGTLRCNTTNAKGQVIKKGQLVIIQDVVLPNPYQCEFKTLDGRVARAWLVDINQLFTTPE